VVVIPRLTADAARAMWRTWRRREVELQEPEPEKGTTPRRRPPAMPYDTNKYDVTELVG
jgi:hypothetical protein